MLTLWFIDSLAHSEYSQLKLPACADEIGVHCGGLHSGSARVIHCLQENQPKLSDGCKAAVAAPTDFAMPNDGASLTVTISGVKSSDGYIWLTLGDDEQSFPRGRRAIVVPAQSGSVAVTFRHLKPNRYFVLAYHDANDNGTMDRNSLGLPTEGGCFSNNVIGFPSFKRTAIAVSNDIAIEMKMNYLVAQ
jgi:uncharacterized protein (DUF2141 family)